MSEIGARLTWVLGAVVVAVVAIMILRKYGGRRRPVRIHQTALGAGIYLFTSTTCPDCETARGLLAGVIGLSGFVEKSWESDPGLFRAIGVGAVPATLIVTDADGSTLYPGRPDRALESLGP